MVGLGTGQGFTFTGGGCPEAPQYPITLTPPTGNYDRLLRFADRFEYQPKGSRIIKVYGVEQPSGRWLLTAIKDMNGNTLTVARDGSGAITSLTDAAGRTATFAYQNGRCTRIQAPGGTQADFVYDGQGNLVEVTDLAGVVTTYAYNADGYMTSMTAGGKVTSFTYDPQGKGNIATMTDPEGKVVRYAKGEAVNTVIRTDPNNHTTIYTSKSGKTTKIEDHLNRQITVHFGDNGLPEWSVKPGNAITEFAYDQRGNETTVTRRANSLSLTETRTYDGDNLTSLTTAGGVTTTYGYDSADNLVSITSDRGRVVSIARNPQTGLVTSITAPDLASWTMTRDEKGNVTALADPGQKTTRFEYDPEGINTTAAIDPLNRRTTFVYDNNRRLTRINWPDGTNRRFTYDCCAPTSIVDELQHSTTFEFDGNMRLAKLIGPTGDESTFGHDDVGNLTSMTNDLGNSWNFAYDSLDRLQRVEDPLQGVLQLSYTILDTVSTLQDQNIHQTGFDNDYLGRPTGVRYSGGSVVSKTLDGDGRVTLVTKWGAIIVAGICVGRQAAR